MQAFPIFQQRFGLLKEMQHADCTFELWGWDRHIDWQPSQLGTHFGAVSSGKLTLDCDSGQFDLTEGMVYCIPGRLRLQGLGSAFGITTGNYRGFFQIAGPVEEVGRLRYIDGCTDSLIVAPQIVGDPCLNHLHFPPRTKQTQHTHPSFRAGLVLRGSGICRLAGSEVPLVPGTIFYLPNDVIHGFSTDEESMDVIAFHPDSNYGPMHDDHPMINRTMIEGVSASKIAKNNTPQLESICSKSLP